MHHPSLAQTHSVADRPPSRTNRQTKIRNEAPPPGGEEKSKITVAAVPRSSAMMGSSSSSSSSPPEPPSSGNGSNSSGYSNHLQTVTVLQNDYYALRHGQSLANVAGVIASDPDVACFSYGLSDVGREQAERAATALVGAYREAVAAASLSSSSLPSPAGIAVVTSDLLRARETAQIVADAVLATASSSSSPSSCSSSSPSIPLYGGGVVVDVRLRERRFGKWDGQSDVHYHDVWKDDAADPAHTANGVESVWAVTDRATQCVMEWDKKLAPSQPPDGEGDGGGRRWWVVCVAHGDVLQILQTAFCRMDPALHRSLQHLETATLRPLELREEAASSSAS